MAKDFTAQVSAIVLRHKALADAVARESIGDLIEEMQTPKGKGGSMPLDTGFLRASGQVSFSGMPTGPIRPPEDAEPGSIPYMPDVATAQLAGLETGQKVFFGWTAIYARRQNFYNGFRDKALQNWQNIVNNVVRRLAKRV